MVLTGVSLISPAIEFSDVPVYYGTQQHLQVYMRKFLKQIKDEKIRKGLYYSVLDGVLWACMFGVSENYIAPFIVFFGASVMQVSLLQGFSQLE